MKNYVFTGLILGGLLGGCGRDNALVPDEKLPAPNENVAALHAQFHGKYNVIQATSDVAVDIDLDGLASTDLVGEYGQLQYSELRITVRDGFSNGNKMFLFSQGWPEQYVNTTLGEWRGEAIPYEKGVSVNLVNQGAIRFFSLSPDLKTIYVKPDADSTTAPMFRWVRPESVTVESSGMLTVITKRRVYTSAGVKDIHITTLYQRYTMTT